MDFALTDDQQAFRDLARGWVDKAVVPHAAEWDRSERMDRDIVRQLGEMGFLGATLPEELGGTPCDYISYVLMMEELGRGDNSVRGIVSVSLGLVTKSIVSYGTAGQQHEWVPRLAAGEVLGCFGLTEPGHGSDPGQPHHQGGARRRRLGAVGPEAVHHQRELGRSGADLRPHRRARDRGA